MLKMSRTQKTRMIKNLIGLEKLIFNQADEKSHPFDFSFNYAFCYEQTSPLGRRNCRLCRICSANIDAVALLLLSP